MSTGERYVPRTRFRQRPLSARSGRAIVFQEIEPDVLRHALVAAGVPADDVKFLLLILGYLKEGYNARILDSVERLLARPASGDLPRRARQPDCVDRQQRELKRGPYPDRPDC